jgi:hypothetical protein
MFCASSNGRRIMEDDTQEPPVAPAAEQTPLRPATPEEVEETLSFALRFKGRKRADVAGPEASGFVVMKRPAGQAPSTTRHHQRTEDEA